MKMPIIFTILILFTIVFTGYYLFNYIKMVRQPVVDSPNDLERMPEIIIDGKHSFKIEIANTEALRQKGLMNRAYLASDHGMLFEFENSGFHSFWMKNTLIPLDMIWINQDLVVTYIYKNAQPCSNIISAICNSVIPMAPGKYVLEINGGLSDQLNISPGDKVQLNY